MSEPERVNDCSSKTPQDGFANTSHTKTLSAFIAGGIVGCTELLIAFPFDLAKTQLQLDKVGKPNSYLGIRDVMKRTIETNGVLGLYKGLAVVMCFKLPQESIRFGVHEEIISRSAKDERGNVFPSMRFFSGLLAGFAEAVVAVTPMDTIKVKLIHDQRNKHPIYKGFFLKAILKMIKKEGFSGIYQGFTPTVIKQGSNQGIRFFLVDTFKNMYKGDDPVKRIPHPVIGLFGVFAGCASVIANNPIDVVKTRLQGFHGREYGGMINCFKRIYNEEGLYAFYKGMKARFFRVGVDAGLTFMSFDFIMDLISAILTPE